MTQYRKTNELQHHGIKGMKWGVRRSKEELDRLAGRAYKVETHDDGSYTIKKGSKLHRVSANTNPNRKGYAYVSFINEDVKGYRKEIAQWLDEEAGVKTFDLTMKATKDIRIPSEVTKVNTFLDLIGNNKIDTIEMAILKHNSTNSNDELIGKPQRLRDAMVKKGLDKETATYYALFSMCLYKNNDYKDVFFKALKDQGYDAIEDLEDSFSHRVNPLIIFERENSLKVTKVSEIPAPDFDSSDWLKIVKEAEEARLETEKYHKRMGIK